ncbi:MAG: hypothetical protein ACRDOD_05285, partial [Streptosporangiaceae bacterium]
MHNLANPPSSSAEAVTGLRLSALERQLAGLSGRLQLAEEQNLALEGSVTGPAAELERIRGQELTLKTLEELAGYGPAFPAARRSRPRHLQALP